MSIGGVTSRSLRAFALTFVCGFSGSQAQAFQVLPKVSDVDRTLTKYSSNGTMSWVGQLGLQYAIPMLKGPVHEAITIRALGCASADGYELSCVTKENILRFRTILYGVRWPDDPPFSLSRSSPPRVRSCDANVTLRSTSQPRCWYALFKDAARLASQNRALSPSFGPGTYLLYRSHFGDLQFMHSMAAFDGESASETANEMKIWAKYLWGIATKRLDTTVFLRDLKVGDLGQHFPGDLTTVNLLSTGLPSLRQNLDEVAIGVLLHMVQDSFSRAHTDRADASGAGCPGMPSALAPGKIGEFHSYARQDGDLHDHQDTDNALGLQTIQERPTVIDVSSTFIALWREGADWGKVEPYFDCVFAISDGSKRATAGAYLKVK